MKRARGLILAGVLALSACATGPSQAGWTGSDVQPFDTAVAACRQTSRGSDDNFKICMAGRGWVKRAQ